MNRFGLLLALSTISVLTGCKTMQFGKAGIVPAIVEAQAPGVASGAGSTITGPTNSGAPTTQVAERRATYFPPFPGPVASVRVNTPTSGPMTPAPKETGLPVNVAPVPVQPVVSSTYERTETTFGQHQSATGLVKAAATMEGWVFSQILGFFIFVGGIAGLLWCAGHDKGYPLICWKLVGCGILLMYFTNPLWLLTLILPALLYAGQRFGIIKLPL